MRNYRNHIFVALVLLSFASAKADVLFNSFNAPDTSETGYMNPGTQWGDEITLNGNSAVLNSISFKVYSVYSTYSGPSTFTLSLWNVNPGTDGLYQTGDDKIGTLITNFTYSGMTIANNTAVTLGGFSVAVPDDFIYTVTDGNNLSYLLTTTSDSTFTGGSANPDIMWWNISSYSGNGSLGTGSSPGNYSYSGVNNNPVTEITGTIEPVPEPSTAQFALGGILVLVSSRSWLSRRNVR
jgi:hypothetical protein